MLRLPEALANADVSAALAALDGLDARSEAARAVMERLAELAGPPEARGFAVIDLVLATYTCDPTKSWVYRRGSSPRRT